MLMLNSILVFKTTENKVVSKIDDIIVSDVQVFSAAN